METGTDIDVRQAVRELRQALGESQQAFAYRLKTALRTIARWETVRPPRGSTLALLARVAHEANRQDLAAAFESALAYELGPWNSKTEYWLLVPSTPVEKELVGAVLRTLRNPRHAALVPELKKLLSGAHGPMDEVIHYLKTVNARAKSLELIDTMVSEGREAEEIKGVLAAQKLPCDDDEVARRINARQVKRLESWAKGKEESK